MIKKILVTASSLCTAIFSVVVLTHESHAAWQNAQSVKQLYVAAQAERTVTVCGTNGFEVSWIPEAFERAFPGIEVKTVADGSITARVIAEARAKRTSCDVFWSTFNASKPAVDRGLFAKVDWSPFEVPPESTEYDSRMALTNSLYFTVVYNTNLVSAEDAPRIWTDMTDPKYRGRVAAGPLFVASLLGALGLEYGEDRVASIARTMRDDGEVLWTMDILDQIIASGERPFVFAMQDYFAETWKRNGAPVDYVVPTPTPIVNMGTAVMVEAPHPNAAYLAAGWLASPDGKKAREEAISAIDATPSSTHPKAQALYAGERLVIQDTADIRKKRGGLITHMGEIISGKVK